MDVVGGSGWQRWTAAAVAVAVAVAVAPVAVAAVDGHMKKVCGSEGTGGGEEGGEGG